MSGPDRDRAVCAVDVGSSVVKAAVYDGGLRQLGRAQTPFPVTRDGDRAEAALPDVWQAVTATIGAAVDASGVRPAVLALTTQMAGLVLLDGAYRPAGPYIAGIDRRAGGIYPADKLAWLAEREPARLAAARYAGGLKDFLLHQLCGVWVTDQSSASTTALYDQVSGTWCEEAVRRAGITLPMLPAVVPGHRRVGSVLAAAAKPCGLPAGTPVIAGLGDGPAANLAAGAITPHSLCLSLGTTVVARLLVTRPGPPSADVAVFRQQVDGRAFCVGCRFDAVGDAYTLAGRPGSRLTPDAFPGVLRGLIDWYGVQEIRPTGGRADNPEVAAAIAGDWGLPVRLTGASDGTRGMAALALAGSSPAGLEALCRRIPVTATLRPGARPR